MATTPFGGVIIGRFMPPHAGHSYLIRFARSYTPEVTVFVCTLSHEPIPGELRFAWMSRLFPDVHLVHITEEIPQASRSEEGAYRIWADAIRSRLDHDPRYVFASEEYGQQLAAALDADFVPVDPQREVFPVSGGMIRDDPFAHWRFVPEPVRPWFAKKVVVIEPTGQLVRALARQYRTVHATDYPAYVRSREQERAGVPSATDLSRAQVSSEAALLESANRVLFTPIDAAWILAAADLPQTGRESALDELQADHPTLAPSFIVATGPVPGAYRVTVERMGWELLEAADVDEAGTRVRDRLADFLIEP